MNDKKTKEEDIVKCLVEKETIPRNQVDLQLLRLTFERPSSNGSRTDQRRGPELGHSSFSGVSNGVVHGPAGSSRTVIPADDVVDQSLPSITEVLVKFRRLERSRRPGTGSERKGRSSSEERFEGRGTSEEFRGAGLNRRSFELEDSEGDRATPQITALVAMFRQMEGKKPSRGSGKKPGTEQQRSSFRSKEGSPQKVRDKGRKDSRGQESEGGDGGEMGMPEEGTVQALLLQWKALEEPLKKKRKSWMKIQVSRQAPEKANQSPSTSRSAQKTPGVGQKSPGIPQKNPGAVQKTTEASQRTVVASQKATVMPQKTNVASRTRSAAHGHKPDIQKDVGMARIASIEDSGLPNGPRKNVTELGTRGDIRERTGTEKEQEDDHVTFGDHVTFDGITRNMAEKFREMERRNGFSDGVDGRQRKKEFKWKVKSPSILGGPQGHALRTEPITPAMTPPIYPDPSHFSDQRPPDLVEHSIADSGRATWKSDLEVSALPSQTKKVLALFEAGHIHPSTNHPNGY